MLKELKNKICVAVSRFADVSTIHGIREIKEAPHVTFKLAWLMALAASSAYFGFQTKSLFDAFNQQATTISIEELTIEDYGNLTLVYCSDGWVEVK